MAFEKVGATKPPVPQPYNPQQLAGPVRFAKPVRNGHRIGIYGPGGIGKTSLAELAPGTKAWFDLDNSLAVLGLTDENVIEGAKDWAGIMAALNGPGWDGIKNIVLDTCTCGEEFAVAHTVATVPHDKGHPIRRIEDYGFGKGCQHVYDTFLPLLASLDAHCRAGRNVILLMHSCTDKVPNPQGDDYLRYEPRLQSPASGKASIRLRVREWLDHLLFIGYDIEAKDGKGKGCGTRTIYPVEMPHCMAKSRTLDAPFEFEKGSTALWEALGI